MLGRLQNLDPPLPDTSIFSFFPTHHAWAQPQRSFRSPQSPIASHRIASLTQRTAIPGPFPLVGHDINGSSFPIPPILLRTQNEKNKNACMCVCVSSPQEPPSRSLAFFSPYIHTYVHVFLVLHLRRRTLLRMCEGRVLFIPAKAGHARTGVAGLESESRYMCIHSSSIHTLQRACVWRGNPLLPSPLHRSRC